MDYRMSRKGRLRLSAPRKKKKGLGLKRWRQRLNEEKERWARGEGTAIIAVDQIPEELKVNKSAEERNLHYLINGDSLPSVQAIKKEPETSEEISTPEEPKASTSRYVNPCEESAADNLNCSEELTNDSSDMDPKTRKRSDSNPDQNSKRNKPLVDEEELLQKSYNVIQVASKEGDESFHFGNLVACKLRTLDEYTRSAVQADIMNLFMRANAGYYKRKSADPVSQCPSSTATPSQ